ncbi:MAG: preprotein translocase subunit YajC [Azoarcus sp.]|nr:preprotein translocase subunit YajC [Azoarcus sp.]
MLISNAYAQEAATGQAAAGQVGGGFEGLLLPILFIVVLYFLMIRPQTKRAKEHKTMLDALSKGDEVVTGGGILGKIVEVGEDNFVQIEIAANTTVAIQKQSIATVLPKGTLKNI